MSVQTPGARPPRRRPGRKLLVRGTLAGLLVAFGLSQLVPYGHGHSNPPVTRAAAFPSPVVRDLAKDACGDCHSNLTDWWWGTKVAPFSWLAQSDVDGGRSILNFSEWDHPQPQLERVVKAIESGEMPPLQYKIVHSGARLSQDERARLVTGIEELYAEDPPSSTR